MSLFLYLLLQPEIPKPEKTEPGEVWGVYSMQDFLVANWYYITAVIILLLIVMIAARQKKKTRRRRDGEIKK